MAFYILILLLFCEGLGIFLFHTYLPYFLALIPSLLIIYRIIHHNDFRISFSPSALLLGCSTFLYTISIASSANKEASIESILVFISLYLFYLYFSSYPINKHSISTHIYILCAIFIGGFLVYSNQRFLAKPFYIPQTEYQLVSPLYYPHNHLGDFLGLGMVISFYYFLTTSRLKYLVLLFIFIPFVLISFSNSAYLSITLTCITLIFFALRLYHTALKKVLIIFTFVVLTMVIFFIGSTKESANFPAFKNIQQYITKTFSFYPKTLGSTRFIYFLQAIEGIKQHPLTGIGPNNFARYSSQIYQSARVFTTDVHNIFLEIGVEAGLPALLFFLVFIVFRIRHGIINPSLSFFIFLYFLFNFQTDYTYKIYSILLFFIFSASQINRQNQNKNTSIGTFVFSGTALFLQVIIICIITSLIFQKSGSPSKAVLFNPFNRYAYYDLLKEASAQHNNIHIDEYAGKLRNISKVNIQSELIIADAYQTVVEPQKQLQALQSAYHLQPILSPNYIEQLYALILQFQSKKQADQLITSYISNRQQAMYYVANKQTVEELRSLCKKTYEKACEKVK